MSPRNKFAVYFDEIDKYRGHAMSAGDDPETASVVWNSPAYNTGAIKWTSTMSSRLLLEAGYSRNLEYYTNEYQPGIEKPRGTPEWFANASRNDRDRVARTTASPNQLTQSPERHNVQASASYVTGSHNIKTGLQLTWADFVHTRDANADLVQEYRNGVPDTVLVRNTPYRSAEQLNRDLGIFAQDQWSLKRLTVNAGIRWEHELMPRLSLTASWYRGNFGNLTLQDNQLVTLSDWTPVRVFNPINGAPMVIYDSPGPHHRDRAAGAMVTA